MTIQLSSPEFLLPPVETPSPESLEQTLTRLKAEAPTLQRMTGMAVIEALSRWVTLWLQPDFFWRRQAVKALHELGDFSEPVLEEGLDELFGAWSREAMIELVTWELGAAWLEEGGQAPISLDGMSRRHISPQLVGAILAGNVPPPSLQALMAGLLVRSPVFLKASRRAPWFPAILVASLQAHVPELGACVECGVWEGEATQTTILLRSAEAVLAYGNDSTIRQLKAQCPLHTRLLGHGHRVSVAYLARESLLDNSLALMGQALARDIALYDQQGCLSPHVIVVEESGEVSVPALCEHLASVAMPEVARRWPLGQLSLGQASAQVQFKGVVSFTGELWDGEGGAVCLTEAEHFEPSCLGRVVLVKAVSGLPDALRYLEPIRHHLQGVALEADEVRWQSLALGLGAFGASRICRPGQLQAPSAAWTGDGSPVLRDLTRLVTLEP